MKTIDNKIDQGKSKYSLYREKAKILALSSGNVAIYEFLAGKDVLS